MATQGNGPTSPKDNEVKEPNSNDDSTKCKICNKTFDGKESYEEHLESKEHIKTAMKIKYGKKYLKAKEALEKGEEHVNNEENGVDDDEEDDNVYTCTTCKKLCTGIIPYKLHLASRAHAKQCRKVELLEQLKNFEESAETPNDPLYDVAPDLKPFATCAVCKKTFSGPENFKQHQKSEAHKKKVGVQNLLKTLEETSRAQPDEESESEEDEEAKPFARCEQCNKAFSGPLPYHQHMISDAHKKQVKSLKYLSKMQDLVITSDDTNHLECKFCGKKFSGPRPLKEHMASGVHSKLQKKTEMMESLQQNYPEMVKGLSDDSENEESDEESHILHCNICHVAFSGPESAKSHFLSKKHIKAKKEKKKLEALMAQKQRNQKAADALKAQLKKDKDMKLAEDATTNQKEVKSQPKAEPKTSTSNGKSAKGKKQIESAGKDNEEKRPNSDDEFEVI